MMRWIFNALELDHQAMLDILRISALLFKLSDRFFSRYGVSAPQFAVLMSINEVGEKGLCQQELSERLVVDKSNIVGLIDRLEKKGFVERKPWPGDRRYYRIILGAKGIEILKKVEGPYLKEVRQMMSHLSIKEKMNLRKYAAKLNAYARSLLGNISEWPRAVK